MRQEACQPTCLAKMSVQGAVSRPGPASLPTRPRLTRRRHHPPTTTAAAAAAAPSGGAPTSSPSAALARFVRANYLPLALLAGMAAGVAFPAAGAAAAKAGAGSWATAGIFLISGLRLSAGDAARAAASWREVGFGLASILILSPVLAAPLAAAAPVAPPALATGLAVFFCMPTTLSSGVALTAAAGGDAALALLLTVASNLLGVVTAPLAISVLLGGGGGNVGGTVSIDPLPLLRSLAACIAAPLLLGAAARAASPRLARAVDARKAALSYLSATLLAAVPWMQVSRAVRAGAAVPPAALALTAGVGLALHALLLLLNGAAVATLGLGSGDPAAGARDGVGGRFRARLRPWLTGRGPPPGGPAGLALLLVCSQKTLPIAVAVLGRLLPPAAAGLAATPCVAVHLGQIVLDGVLAGRWVAAAETKN